MGLSDSTSVRHVLHGATTLLSTAHYEVHYSVQSVSCCLFWQRFSLTVDLPTVCQLLHAVIRFHSDGVGPVLSGRQRFGNTGKIRKIKYK